MLDRPLPIYVCPGKVYRADEFDATHVPVFRRSRASSSTRHLHGPLVGTLQHSRR